MAYVHYPLSFKLKVVSEVILNEEKKGIQSKVASKYGLSNFSISSWVKKYREKVETTDKDKTNIEVKPNPETTTINIKPEDEILKSIIMQKEFELKYLKDQYSLQINNI